MDRKRWLIVVAVLLAALAIYLLSGRRDGAAPETATATAPARQAPRSLPVTPAPASTATPAPVTLDDTPPGALPDQGSEQAVPPAKDAAFPYPPGSQPLFEGSDPATTVSEDDPVDDAGTHVVFGVRWDVVHPPDPLIVDLQVLDAHGKRVAISAPEAHFHSDHDTPDEAGFAAPFVDDGTGADRAAADLAYTVTFRPNDPEQKLLTSGHRVFVEVGFQMPTVGARRYVTSLIYSPLPAATLDGKFTETVENGSLVVGVGLNVKEAGQFKVIASLYSADDKTALVFAQESRPLDTGEQSIPLTFFGKILHDRNVDGPYVLRYMMVFQEFPDRGSYYPGVTVDHAYTTKAYRAADFSPDPYVAPPVPQGEVITADSPSQQGKPPAVGHRPPPTPPVPDQPANR